jgi:hypothetical protein
LTLNTSDPLVKKPGGQRSRYVRPIQQVVKVSLEIAEIHCLSPRRSLWFLFRRLCSLAKVSGCRRTLGSWLPHFLTGTSFDTLAFGVNVCIKPSAHFLRPLPFFFPYIICSYGI